MIDSSLCPLSLSLCLSRDQCPLFWTIFLDFVCNFHLKFPTPVFSCFRGLHNSLLCSCIKVAGIDKRGTKRMKYRFGFSPRVQREIRFFRGLEDNAIQRDFILELLVTLLLVPCANDALPEPRIHVLLTDTLLRFPFSFSELVLTLVVLLLVYSLYYEY